MTFFSPFQGAVFRSRENFLKGRRAISRRGVEVSTNLSGNLNHPKFLYEINLTKAKLTIE